MTDHHHRSNSRSCSSSPCCTFCFNRLFIFVFCVSALITTSCMGTERSVWSALRNICEWLFHYSDAHYWKTCVILIVGVVFRKALGDGKRAIILQPDWAKVSAVSLIHPHQFELTICWESGQTRSSSRAFPKVFFCLAGPLSLLWRSVLPGGASEGSAGQPSGSESVRRRRGGSQRPAAAVRAFPDGTAGEQR